MLFLGPFALARIVEEKAKEWAAKLEVELGESFEVKVLDPPFDVETDLEEKGYWLRPVAKDEKGRVTKLRKHALTSLVALLDV